MCHVNDILFISHDPGISFGWIQAVFIFKGDKIDKPDIYLGAQVGNMIVDGADGWYMSADNYVGAAIENVEQNLTKSNQRLPTGCKTPIMSGYRQ